MKTLTRTEQISSQTLSQIAARFSALGSEQRLGLMQILVRAGPEGLNMGAIAERTGITGSTLTHHLKILAQVGLVTQKRMGRQFICTAIAYPQVRELSEFLLLNCCVDRPGHQENMERHEHE